MAGTTASRTAAGVAFAESMKGWFALGESDPLAGAERGRRAGSELSLRARIRIGDVRRFREDPEHRGTLDGAVSLPPLATEGGGSGGVFKLFAPGGEVAPRIMLYQLPFQADGGESYCFVGRKHLRRPGLLRLWPETTTLYSRIHRGPDGSGEVVGAGVLRLGVPQLARMLTTFRSSAPGITRRVGALSGFGGFFLGQLWRCYILREIAVEQSGLRAGESNTMNPREE